MELLHLYSEFGVTKDRRNTLTHMNDEGLTFKEIAKFIRDNPEQVFINFADGEEDL